MSEDLDVKVFDNMDDAIKYMMNKYAETLIALSDCPNITKEMKEHKFEDKKTDKSIVKIKLGDDPMCDAIRDCTMTYMDDKINHPKHYCEGRKYEPIDVIEDWGLGMHGGNAVKYISRAGRKGDAIEDLEKARWYVDRYVQKNDKFFIKLWQKIRRWFVNTKIDITPDPHVVAKDWGLNGTLKSALSHIALGNLDAMKFVSVLLTREIDRRKEEAKNGRI